MWVDRALENGTAVFEGSGMYWIYTTLGKWYRSKGHNGVWPFASYLLNKKWTMEEEFNNHMMRLQQVSQEVLNNFIKLHFHIPGFIVNG